MLHAAWRDGLVVFGWRGRALDRRTVTSFAATLFLEPEMNWGAQTEHLVVPGRAQPMEVTTIEVPIATAAQAFLVRGWIPWKSLSPSLSWFARIARLADALAAAGMVVPALAPSTAGASGSDAQPAIAHWQPVIDDAVGRELHMLTEAMPPVVATLCPEFESWQITAVAVAAFVDDAARTRLWETVVTDPLPRDRSAPSIVARRFLSALTSDASTVSAHSAHERAAVTRLAETVNNWSAALTGRSPLAGLAVSARVVPPTDVDISAGSELAGFLPEELPWIIDLELSPISDPSLSVTAASVWATRSGQLLGVPDEQAEAALHLAARRIASTAPTLAAALDRHHPAGGALPLAELMTFLDVEAARLEGSGVRVLLPSWWGRNETAKVRGTARPSEPAVTSAGLEARSLAEVDWRLVLGDQRLDEAELARLAEAKQSLVFMRGRWVAFDQDKVRHALTVLTRHQRDDAVLGPLDVLKLAAEAERLTGDVATELAGDGWIAELLAGLPDERLVPVVEPPSFRGQLRPYQQRGLGWLTFLTRLGLGGCLADDMGLGKTAQLLALLASERAGSVAAGPTLVVCPLSVVRNWETETARFTPELSLMVHHGTERARGDGLASAVAGSDLVVTTYALAARDVGALSAIRWGRLVADEAQHVKNPHTAAAKALRAIPAEQKLALTGTPVENRLSELWSVLDLVNPGLLGTSASFRDTYSIPIEKHRSPEATAALRAIVQPFLLRRSKADRTLVPELPPKIEQVAWATLTREQASLYRSVVDVLLARLDSLDGIDRRGAILAAITRLKQICNHPAHYLGDGSRLEGRSGKLSRFDELVDDVLDADEQLLVFTQYREMGLLLAKHLRDRVHLNVPFLHGGVAKSRRDAMVERFQDGSGGPILLVSLKAGGSGLNLTAASQVVHYDRWWNPAVENQASDRAWRIGQERTVVVHKLACQGTIEERVDALINAKRDLADRVVGAGEAWLTELSTAEIRQLLTLGDQR